MVEGERDFFTSIREDALNGELAFYFQKEIIYKKKVQQEEKREERRQS